MKRIAYSYNKKATNFMKQKIAAFGIATITVVAAVVPSINVLQGLASAKGGGGVPGEGITYVVRYDALSCPLPASVIAEYEQILSCGLVKRTGANKDYYIRVDGYTQLAPIVRDVKSAITVTLPCGNVSVVDKFTENSFAQTSPVPPPYRLYTESVKFTDTCL